LGSFDSLQGPDPVWLQAVRRPDALYAAMAHPGRLGHLDHPFDDRRRQRRHARGPRCLSNKPSTPSAIKRACQRQIVGLPLPVCRWIAIVPTPSALSSTIRARHTCFCGLFPDPTMASCRSRSSAPSRTSMPFLIQPVSHIRKTAGIIPQRQIYLDFR
jgi:hypothetical protein